MCLTSIRVNCSSGRREEGVGNGAHPLLSMLGFGVDPPRGWGALANRVPDPVGRPGPQIFFVCLFDCLLSCARAQHHCGDCPPRQRVRQSHHWGPLKVLISNQEAKYRWQELGSMDRQVWRQW